MADVAETVKKIIPTGLVVVYTGSLSTGSNYQFLNDGRILIHVKNGGGSTDVVTVISQKTVGGLAVADQAVSILAGAEAMIGPFNSDIYNDANGKVNFGHSFITTVTQAAFHLG